MFTLLHGFDQAGHYEHVYEGVGRLANFHLSQLFVWTFGQ
jgi:hypothetical protein